MIVDTNGLLPARATGIDSYPGKTTGPREQADAGRRPACDCHIHVFGPRRRFPLAADLAYTPDEAYSAVRRRLGIERTVVIQPSAYGRAVFVENPAALYGFPPVIGEPAAGWMKPGRLPS